jgi:glutamyl-tRNA synthetase
LLDEDKAYYCECSKERLDNLREALMAKGEKAMFHQSLALSARSYQYCVFSRSFSTSLPSSYSIPSAKGEKAMYDGCCRDKALTSGHHKVVRFKNPMNDMVIFIFNTQDKITLLFFRPSPSKQSGTRTTDV